jgi:hypothetical protein
MKGHTVIVALACVCLIATIAIAQSEHMRAQEDAHQILLKLDLQEAMEHAKALHQYTLEAGDALETDVLACHLEEIEKNLGGADEQIARIQQIDGDSRFDYQVAEIRNHDEVAREILGSLKSEAAKPNPAAQRINSRAADLYDALNAAMTHDRRSLGSHHVPSPLTPTSGD